MERQNPPVVYDPTNDPSAKFVGMDVPRGCGCSPWLLIAFVVIVILGSIFGT